MITLKELIEYQKQNKISDLHFIEGEVPLARNHVGKMKALSDDPLTKEYMDSFIHEICTEEQKQQFIQFKTLDLAKELYDFGRFRINLFHERRGRGMNIRIIHDNLLDVHALDIPEKVLEKVRKRSGLILISGPNNAGKTTMLNALIDLINIEEEVNIITFEDPIEYVHKRKKSVVSQREITKEAREMLKDDLKSVFRQDADVICVGEIRDFEMMSAVIEMCETGYLVMGTIHATNVEQTVDRVINLMSDLDRKMFCKQLADQLKVILCQYLVPGTVKRLVPIREILILDDAMRHVIQSGDLNALPNQMEISGAKGNILFDHYLIGLYEHGLISADIVKRYAQSNDTVRAVQPKKPRA